jgi:hypothetical protein
LGHIANIRLPSWRLGGRSLRKRCCLKRWFIACALLFPLCCSSIASAPQECVVNDEEEYAVLAAVLFPNDPDIPKEMKTDPQKKAYLAAKTIRLDGFHGSSYSIQDESMPAKSAKNKDRELIADFNPKNERACRLIPAKLLAHLLPNQTVNFRSAEEIQKQRSLSSTDGAGREKTRGRGIGHEEITRLSRPGFNSTNTVAVVEVDLIADYEMGVGYWVYLQKSPKTGKWIITSADRIRMY